jgi:hypothetical protein
VVISVGLILSHPMPTLANHQLFLDILSIDQAVSSAGFGPPWGRG